MTRAAVSVNEFRPRVLLVGIIAPYNYLTDQESYLNEFVHLVKSHGIEYDETVFIRLRTIDSSTFISQGKLEDLIKVCKEKNIDEVIISEPLSPQQERNLADYLHCKVFDRTQLILEIFERHAHSAEGKVQVQIAMLKHRKSRLAGKGVQMSQQGGIMGIRGGFGETAKEKERRHIEEMALKFKRELEKIAKVKETQRQSRLKSGWPLFCLIGYTNAGKSTILNALTQSNVLAEDKLFATLDTTTRELFVEGKKKALISDTVGFIQLLPSMLLEAFKSTLAELKYADLLLHVVDAADKNWIDHIKVVQQIMHELGVQKPVLYIFNKIDAATIDDTFLQHARLYQPHVLISAHDPKSLELLKKSLADWKPSTQPIVSE